jgi:hypothetical protein
MSKNEPNAITLDELAAMIAREFGELREETATKSDLKDGLADVREELTEVRGEMQTNFQQLRQEMLGQFDLVLKTLRQNYEPRLSRAEEDIHELQDQM